MEKVPVLKSWLIPPKWRDNVIPWQAEIISRNQKSEMFLHSSTLRIHRSLQSFSRHIIDLASPVSAQNKIIWVPNCVEGYCIFLRIVRILPISKWRPVGKYSTELIASINSLRPDFLGDWKTGYQSCTIWFFCGPFYEQGLNLIPAWISNLIPREVYVKITYPFQNLNGCGMDR